MRKCLCLFLTLLCATTTLYAQQKKKKGSLFKAEFTFQQGLLDHAKNEIDLVVQQPKKAKKTRVWLLRGKIYRAIMLSDKEAYRTLDDNASITAVKSFAKVMEIDSNNQESPDYVDAYNASEELWGHHVQKGINYYNEKSWKEAYDEFVIAVAIKPEDSVSLSYAGYFAQLNNDSANVVRHYYKLVEVDKASKSIYKDLIQLEWVKNRLDPALDLTKKAINRYPDDIFFQKQELLILIKQKKSAIAQQKVKNLRNYADNDLRVALFIASFYEDQAEPFLLSKKYKKAAPYLDTATIFYEKALKQDSSNVAAAYNVSLAYMNISQQYYHELRHLSDAAYRKAAKTLRIKGKAVVTKALPHLERAYLLAPDDVDIIGALQQVYYLLDRKKEAKKYQEKLEKLIGDGR